MQLHPQKPRRLQRFSFHYRMPLSKQACGSWALGVPGSGVNTGFGRIGLSEGQAVRLKARTSG